jgi:hypothetical protein
MSLSVLLLSLLLLIGQALVNPLLIVFGWVIGWFLRRVWQILLAAAIVAPLVELTLDSELRWDGAALTAFVVDFLAIVAWAMGTRLFARTYVRPGPVSAQRLSQLIAMPVCLAAGAGLSILGANTAVAAGRKLAQWLNVDATTGDLLLAAAEPYGMLLFMLICGAFGWVVAGRTGGNPKSAS